MAQQNAYFEDFRNWKDSTNLKNVVLSVWSSNETLLRNKASIVVGCLWKSQWEKSNILQF